MALIVNSKSEIRSTKSETNREQIQTDQSKPIEKK
jgi:hypothetical protein